MRGDFLQLEVAPVPADRENLLLARLGAAHHRLAPLTVHGDDDGRPFGQQFVEQTHLGGEIVFKVGVVVEMVLGEVGKTRQGDLRTVHAALFQSMT